MLRPTHRKRSDRRERDAGERHLVLRAVHLAHQAAQASLAAALAVVTRDVVDGRRGGLIT
jgi:hypothetical protein